MSNTFNCTGDHACSGQTLTCNNNEDCTIICNGYWSCNSTTMICPSSSNTRIQTQCNILCRLDFSCKASSIYGGINSELYINTSGPYAADYSYISAINSLKLTVIGDGESAALYMSKIICPSSSNTSIQPQCNIACHGIDSCYSNIINGGINSELYINASGSLVLAYSNISAMNSSKLTMIGDGNYAFLGSKIICPHNCNLIYNGDLAGFQETWISRGSSVNGLNMTCSQFSISACWSDYDWRLDNRPRMYCTNLLDPWNGTYCNMTTNNGYDWNCDDQSNECDITNNSDTNRSDWKIIVSIVCGAVFVIIVAVFLLYRYKNRNKMNNGVVNINELGANNYESINPVSQT